MKPTLKQMEIDILQHLAVGLAPHGFEFDKKATHFEKHTSDHRWSFRPGFIKHGTDFDIIASVAVRIDPLERLIYENDEVRAEKGYSLGAELGNISQGRQRRWTVSRPGDIETVAKSVLAEFERTGLPYLQMYSVMENALEVLSGDDKSAWLHSPLHDERAKRAIGLAFLLGKKEVFDKLAEKKTAFLEKRNDSRLQLFIDFRNKLKNRLKAS